ncbi:hypothetical protein ACIQGZ_17540 [Streptomyces sp. NPDC092296]|uniref:hypothetical protein n=1 Tax=Streptomyces sp. NPDC092296 TaxID=3366012 RepID=UPI0038048679
MTGHYSGPVFRTDAEWMHVVLSDQHVREETLRGLARSWVEDPAVVAEQLGLLAEADGHADQFSSACLDAEVDLQLGDATVELRLCDAEALLRQLSEAVARVRRDAAPVADLSGRRAS